jgi:hypothetical protein
MSITLLRWKSGAGGDTVLKLLLASNNLHSQNRYLSSGIDQTEIDFDYVNQFRYEHIAKMSTFDCKSVDPVLLQQQLLELEQDDPTKHWLLKCHCYFDIDYPVIDITVDLGLVPFVVKASLSKNSREKNLVPEYHPVASKITNKNVLYKFDCFSYSYDLVKNSYHVHRSLPLQHVLGGWGKLKQTLMSVGFNLNDSCQEYYQNWLDANQRYLPSKKFNLMLAVNDYDYNCPDLSIEERYCFLVMSGQKFSVLL